MRAKIASMAVLVTCVVGPSTMMFVPATAQAAQKADPDKTSDGGCLLPGSTYTCNSIDGAPGGTTDPRTGGGGGSGGGGGAAPTTGQCSATYTSVTRTVLRWGIPPYEVVREETVTWTCPPGVRPPNPP